MKKVCTIVFLSISLFCDAQTKQQTAQMEKELKELEKDDPDMAKQVRTMMKQKGASPSAATSFAPKFVSPITPIPLKQPVSPPSESQANDRLLWFKGKKINDSILVTAKNTVVMYQKKKNQVVVQPPAAKDPFKKIVSELSNNEKKKTDLINSVASKKNSFFFYPFISEGLKEYDKAAKQYGELLKNTVSLPPVITPSTSFTIPASHSGGVASSRLATRVFEIPGEVKRVHEALMDEMRKYPSLDFPPPPARDFSFCHSCDSNVSKKYDAEVEQWQEDFLAYERSLIERAISVLRTLSLKGLDSDPEAVAIKADMDKVIEFSMNRNRNKVDLLIRNYGKDFARLPAIIQQAIAYERQKQLLGQGDDSYAGTMQKIAGLLDQFDGYLDEQMKARNYNVVLNMGFVLGMERQKQLLGVSESSGFEYFDRVMAFDRFKLTMDIDAHLQSEDMKADAGAISSGNVYVSLAPIGCRFQFFLTSADYGNDEENNYRIPMKAKGGIKSLKDNDDHWVSYPYSGPTNILGLFPVFSINFCDEEKDTVYLQPPINKPEDMANVTRSSVEKAYTIDHTAFIGMLYLKGTEEAAMEGKDIATEMIAAYTSSHLEEPTGNARLDELQDKYNLTIKSKELQDRMSVAINLNTVMMLFDAQNKEEVIVDAETSPSRTVDEIEAKGKIKIRIVHDPAPYAKPPGK